MRVLGRFVTEGCRGVQGLFSLILAQKGAIWGFGKDPVTTPSLGVPP